MGPNCGGKAMVREPQIVTAETEAGLVIDSNVFVCVKCGRRVASVRRFYPSPQKPKIGA